jgi:hypothetical protein
MQIAIVLATINAMNHGDHDCDGCDGRISLSAAMAVLGALAPRSSFAEPFHARARGIGAPFDKDFFTVVFYGLENFGCKTAQFYATGRER